MSTETLSTDPGFFGKDSFVPFVGTVEDVDDPKRSNRVKIRAVGFHTEDKNELPTEDLPWAKVCMPTTHAQQSGIGGKHGMLPGCWIIGFFMDGESANDPYVLTTFNFTAKAVDKNNRKPVDTSDGKIPKSEPGYVKSIDPLFPNAARALEGEAKSSQPSDKTDPARDVPADASTNGPCPINKSQSEVLRTEEKKSTGQKGNAESQNYKLGMADGICGGIVGARDEIQNLMEEMFVPQKSRFAYGDVVWNKFSGEFINLNGSLLKIAQLVCSLLKFSINTMKAFQEDIIQRPMKSKMVGSIPDRDGIIREVTDFMSSVLSDNFNASISKIIDTLCMIILGILQEMNNSTEEDNRQQSDKVSGGDNRNNRNQKGNIGASTTTRINDGGALCITDELLLTLDAEISKKITDAILEATLKSNQASSQLSNFSFTIQNTATDVFRSDDDINAVSNSMLSSINSMKSMDYDPDPGVPFDESGGGFGDIGSMLGDSAQYLQLVLSLKFILFPQVFNKAGIQVLDELSRGLECISSVARMFDTAEGSMGSMSGVDAGNGFTGGGSDSGKSSKDTKSIQKNTGFGGRPISIQGSGVEYVLCEDAYTSKIKDKDKKINDVSQWAPVDFHEAGRKYNFNGEVKYDTRTSNNSRILVNDQDDPAENGIYLSSAREWKRTEDADESKEFIKYKIVKVINEPVLEKRWWIYVERTNPRLEVHPIKFEPLYRNNTGSYETIEDLVKNKDIDSIAEVIDENTESTQGGKNADVILISLPSDDPCEADNFVNGISNLTVIRDPGKGYYSGNKFPSVYINHYNGTPVPVVNPYDGELVAILTNCKSFTEKSNSISIIKDYSNVGIRSDDEDYNIVMCGVFVANTGESYTGNTTIKVIDRDTGEENGKVKPVIVAGRIVEVEVINSGTRFKRIPELVIEDTLGTGAKLYPFMCLRARNPDSPSVKPIAESVDLSFCIAKNQVNLIRPGRR